MIDLTGKRAIVTGAGMGIGRYIALGLAARGARVAAVDIDQDAIRAVGAEMKSYSNEVLAEQVDVREEEDVARLIHSADKAFGGIDYLVNNAALVPHHAWGGARWPLLTDMEYSFWRRVIDTNLGGSVLCAKYAAPIMARQRSGVIVNVHGGGGRSPGGAMAYVVSKQALLAFTSYLAEEVRPDNICVVSLGPGATIATERAPEEARLRMAAPDAAGERYFLAPYADMSLSGHLVDLQGEQLVPVD